MDNRPQRVNIRKLAFYLLKHIWIIILCAAIGFAGLYCYTKYYQKDTYTSKATVYVLNGNPNLVNYQYTNASDLDSAVQLMNTYMVLLKSDKVMDAVLERLKTYEKYSQYIANYPRLTTNYIASTLSMGAVSNTSLLEIRSTTSDPNLSFFICNAVVDVAPTKIKEVVLAGEMTEAQRPASPPIAPDYRSPTNRGMLGAAAGVVLAAGLLVLLFLLNHRVMDIDSLTDYYTPPVLAGIQRRKKKDKNAAAFLLRDNSSMEMNESYAKLRMNLLYTLAGKENKIVVVSSSISGEGKSTITANLAISCAMSGKQVLLVDADMRRACQREYFEYDEDRPGLSDVLIEKSSWWDTVLATEWKNLSILPAGHQPPNPAELLSLPTVPVMLKELQQQFDLILIDTPPINIVADPLTFPAEVAGCILVVRQNYTDHREVQKALISAEMTGMNMLGFVFYGEKLKQSKYYGRKYYKKYYGNYETQKGKRRVSDDPDD